MDKGKYSFSNHRKQSAGLRRGNMDEFTRGSTKRKRKKRVRGK